MKQLKAIALLYISLGFVQTHAASFDCNKANGYVELTICTTPELSKLDEQLNDLYKKVLIAHPQSIQIIKKAQLAWLKEQRNKATSAEQLKTLYLARISDLKLMNGESEVSNNANETAKVNPSPSQVATQPQVQKEDDKAKESPKTNSSPSQVIPQPQVQNEVPKPIVTPQRKVVYEAYSNRLTETWNEYTRRPGSAVYYCYTYDQNTKNRSAYDGLFLNASHANLLTAEAIDYAEQLHRVLAEFDPNAPQQLKSLMSDFLKSLSDSCNNLADMAYKKGWAL